MIKIFNIVLFILTISCNTSRKVIINDKVAINYKVTHIMRSEQREEIQIEKVKKSDFLILIESFSNVKDSFLIRKYETLPSLNRVTYFYVTDTTPVCKFFEYRISTNSRITFTKISDYELNIIKDALSRFDTSSFQRLFEKLETVIGSIKFSSKSPERY